jgi:enoyl-CoA hydratase/carnithine racemase
VSFELNQRGDVHILKMNAEDNRFNRGSLERINQLLDEVAAIKGPAALVTTGTGKFYSNGLDLEATLSGAAEMSLEELATETQRLFARTLTFPHPTVSAINGHCFAAGAMWSLAHDFRVMRADRGFWSLPEIAIKIPFTAGMAALIQSRLTAQTAHLAMTTAHRFGGEEAHRMGIVDHAVAEDQVLPQAIELAAALTAGDPDTLVAIRRSMYGPVIEALEGPAWGSPA